MVPAVTGNAARCTSRKDALEKINLRAGYPQVSWIMRFEALGSAPEKEPMHTCYKSQNFAFCEAKSV